MWHDGPDLAGRDRLVSTKNAETLALARRVPDRDVRGEHLVWAQPDIVVRLRAEGTDLAAVVASIESLLDASDAHVWVTGCAGWDNQAVEDPRVHLGEPPTAVLARARYVVDCPPVLLTNTTLRRLCGRAPVRANTFTLRTTRDVNRERRGLATPGWSPLAHRCRGHTPGVGSPARKTLAVTVVTAPDPLRGRVDLRPPGRRCRAA